MIERQIAKYLLIFAILIGSLSLVTGCKTVTSSQVKTFTLIAKQSVEKTGNKRLIKFMAELSPQERTVFQQKRVTDISLFLEQQRQLGKLPTDPQAVQRFSDDFEEEGSKLLVNYYSKYKTQYKTEILKDARLRAQPAPLSHEPIRVPVKERADEEEYDRLGRNMGVLITGSAVHVGSYSIGSFNPETRDPINPKQADKYNLAESNPQTIRLLGRLARKNVRNGLTIAPPNSANEQGFVPITPPNSANFIDENTTATQWGVLHSNDGRINLRIGPGTVNKATGYGINGDHVQVLDKSQDSGGYYWYKVRFPKSGAVGWVAAQLIDIDK